MNGRNRQTSKNGVDEPLPFFDRPDLLPLKVGLQIDVIAVDAIDYIVRKSGSHGDNFIKGSSKAHRVRSLGKGEATVRYSLESGRPPFKPLEWLFSHSFIRLLMIKGGFPPQAMFGARDTGLALCFSCVWELVSRSLVSQICQILNMLAFSTLCWPLERFPPDVNLFVHRGIP